MMTAAMPRSARSKKDRERSKQPMAKRSSVFTRLRDGSDLPLKRKLPASRLFLYLFCVCFASITLIWLQLAIDNLSGQIEELDQRKQTLQSRNEYLKLNLEKNTSYEEIYPIVKSNYSMDLHSSEPVMLEVPESVLLDKKTDASQR